LAFDDLLAAFGAAEVLRHLRVAQQLLEQRKVALAPRLEAHGALVGHV
jgi:hypothetical protein